jgi:uncharacterized protein YaaQ
MMKMILCIVQDQDKDAVTQGLNQAGFRVTVLPSTGAYFRRGNATLMIGVDKKRVDAAIETIRLHVSDTNDPNLKRATLFVLNVADFQQI